MYYVIKKKIPGVLVGDWVLVVLGTLLAEGVLEWSACAEWKAKANKAKIK